MNEKFKGDLAQFYDLVSKNQKELGLFYGLVENTEYRNDEICKYVDEFLDECELKHNKENYLALLSRLINLRDEQFVQVLAKEEKSKEDIKKKRALAYLWTKNFHLKREKKLIEEIKNRDLLNQFYRELLSGVYEIGLVMSEWQFDWNEYIIDTINRELEEKYGDGVIDFLRKNELFGRDENGEPADRSYCVLAKDEGEYKIQTYAQFFSDFVEKICKKLDDLVEVLEGLEDNDTNQKEEYVEYFKSLKIAFGEKNKTLLLSRWRDVDRAWMKITSPIQVGHPLEYYEDHYRKAVALEWDVRISNPDNSGANKTYESIYSMYKKLFEKFDKSYKQIQNRTVENLKRVQLYIGRPALFFASEFNGLFSAQVVPNDELVSKEEGKKIFAFADNILDTQRAKPFLKINRIVFGDNFIRKERELIFKKSKIWHRVYEVSTIGHEFGHILWLDSDTEAVMNASGVFKNIEEFKATSGGLVAFFMNEDKEIGEYVFLELIKRAVSLIAWRKTGEVEPYYCEGLIHLKGLFDSGVLEFDGKLTLHVGDEFYSRLKNWYLKTYKELAEHYLYKRDANEFLKKFASKESGDYLPKDTLVRSFVEYYWDLHQDIGREIDESIDKKEWK
ncbi:MAG: invasion protein CiaB [Sulfurospirillum sp.]